MKRRNLSKEYFANIDQRRNVKRNKEINIKTFLEEYESWRKWELSTWCDSKESWENWEELQRNRLNQSTSEFGKKTNKCVEKLEETCSHLFFSNNQQIESLVACIIVCSKEINMLIFVFLMQWYTKNKNII